MIELPFTPVSRYLLCIGNLVSIEDRSLGDQDCQGTAPDVGVAVWVAMRIKYEPGLVEVGTETAS